MYAINAHIVDAVCCLMYYLNTYTERSLPCPE
jgi:hypothetical protein